MLFTFCCTVWHCRQATVPVVCWWKNSIMGATAFMRGVYYRGWIQAHGQDAYGILRSPSHLVHESMVYRITLFVGTRPLKWKLPNSWQYYCVHEKSTTTLRGWMWPSLHNMPSCHTYHIISHWHLNNVVWERGKLEWWRKHPHKEDRRWERQAIRNPWPNMTSCFLQACHPLADTTLSPYIWRRMYLPSARQAVAVHVLTLEAVALGNQWEGAVCDPLHIPHYSLS